MPADTRRALGAAGEERGGRVGTPMPGTRCSTATGGAARASSTSCSPSPDGVVFCEVKTRRGTAFGSPAEAVTLAKQRRLRRLAARWMAQHPGVRARELRFDVASVLALRGETPVIDVIEGAF